MRNYVFGILILVAGCVTAQVWQPLGPVGSAEFNLNKSSGTGGTGQIHAFAFAPSGKADAPYIYYAAAPFGGLWKSTDNGQNWFYSGRDLERVSGVCSVSDVVIDPVDSNIIYVATGHPTKGKLNAPDGPTTPSTGLFKSTDGGNTFSETGLVYDYIADEHIAKITVNKQNRPLNKTQLFAATTQGLLKSNDAGETWVDCGVSDKDMFTVEVSPNFWRNQKVYAAGRDIYVSSDGGNTFKSFTKETGFPVKLEADTTKAVKINLKVYDNNGKDVLYVALYNNGKYSLLFYDGEHWQVKNNPTAGNTIPAPDRIKLAANPKYINVLYAGATSVDESMDGGITWQQATLYCQEHTRNHPLNAHADIHAIEIIPGSDAVLIGTDGGIFKYVPGIPTLVKHVIELNTGLNISQPLFIASPVKDSTYYVIGSQDNGVDLHTEAGWKNIRGGDGFAQAFKGDDKFSIYSTSNQSLNEYVTEGLNTRYKALPTCVTKDFNYYWQLRPDLINSNVLYMAMGDYIFKTTDKGQTWCKVFHDVMMPDTKFGTPFSCFANGYDYNTGKAIIYAGTFGFSPWLNHQSHLIKGELSYDACTGDCGDAYSQAVWEKCNLPSDVEDLNENSKFNLIGVTVSDRNPNHVWVCYQMNKPDEATYKVMRSTDGGTTWRADDAGLPENTSCTAIVYQNGSNDALYLGTRTGVYYKNASVKQWQLLGDSLPKCYIKGLDINYCAGKIRAAAFGRGVWELPLVSKPDQLQAILIKKGKKQVWQGTHYLSADLLVLKKAKFTLADCTIIISGNNKIVIASGAKFASANVKFVNACGEALDPKQVIVYQ
jgi:xyloglucan-specific exo-beta-1,4-glucanase